MSEMEPPLSTQQLPSKASNSLKEVQDMQSDVTPEDESFLSTILKNLTLWWWRVSTSSWYGIQDMLHKKRFCCWRTFTPRSASFSSHSPDWYFINFYVFHDDGVFVLWCFVVHLAGTSSALCELLFSMCVVFCHRSFPPTMSYVWIVGFLAWEDTVDRAHGITDGRSDLSPSQGTCVAPRMGTLCGVLYGRSCSRM